MKEQILSYLKTQGNAKSPSDISKAINNPKQVSKVVKLLAELLEEKEVRRLKNGARVTYKHKDN